MLDSQAERRECHAVRQNTWWSQHEIGDWDGGVADGKFEVHPQLGISLREKNRGV